MISEFINGQEILSVGSVSARLPKDCDYKQEVFAIRGRPVNVYSEDIIPNMNSRKAMYDKNANGEDGLDFLGFRRIIDNNWIIDTIKKDISLEQKIQNINKKFNEDISNIRYTYQDIKENIFFNIRQENKRKMFFDIESDFHYGEYFHHRELTINEIIREARNRLSVEQIMNRNPTLSMSKLEYRGKSCHAIEIAENIIKEKNNKGKSKYHN